MLLRCCRAMKGFGVLVLGQTLYSKSVTQRVFQRFCRHNLGLKFLEITTSKVTALCRTNLNGEQFTIALNLSFIKLHHTCSNPEFRV